MTRVTFMITTIDHPLETANFALVRLPHLNLAYSYNTCIGFAHFEGQGWVLRQNEWGPTTGKHLNWLDADKTRRLPGDEFDNQLRDILMTRIPTGEWV